MATLLIGEWEKLRARLPSGPIAVKSNGSYAFTVMLEVSRLGEDNDGRRYQIIVSAADKPETSIQLKRIGTVPHDAGK